MDLTPRTPDPADGAVSADGQIDLTPREVDEAAAVRRELRKGQRRWAIVAGVVIAGLLGFLLVQFLRDATVFFRNVDEAVAEREELGDRRFRMQGRVIPDSVITEGGVVTFEILHNCTTAAVRHLTEPEELFQNPWIPVVLEGSWQDGEVQLVTGPDDQVFVSDRMLIKHTSEYSADNEDRVATNIPDDFLEGCDITADDVGLEL